MITIKKLAPALGAEIGGVDVTSPLDAATIEAIRHQRKPNLTKDDERLVYEAMTELLERKPLSQAFW